MYRFKEKWPACRFKEKIAGVPVKALHPSKKPKRMFHQSMASLPPAEFYANQSTEEISQSGGASLTKVVLPSRNS